MRPGYQPMHVQVETSRGVWVDGGMAPLLEALWAFGLSTEFSCQEQDFVSGCGNKWAYIAFSTVADATTFFTQTLKACDPDDDWDTVRLESGGREGWVNFRADRLGAVTRLWRA